MKILEYFIISVSLSGWGRPDRGCRDKSDLVTDMVKDDFSNLVCPRNYSFFDGHSPDGTLTVEVTWEWFPCYKTGKGPAALNDTRESPGCFNQILNFES